MPSRHVSRVAEYLEQSYGAERVARLGRYQYWSKAALLRAICQWAGLPKQKAEALIASDAISTRGDKQLRWADLFASGAYSLPPHHPTTVNYIFNRLHPLPRTLAAQEHRLVLCGEPIDQVVPLAYPEQHGPATQLDAADCDALGLPRISLVAGRPLEILDEAISWVHRDEDRSFDLPRIKNDASETFRLLAQGRTAGVLDLEGIGMRALLQRERPANMAQLIQLMTLSVGGREPPRRSPPGTVIADCQLAYRCAYVKAHYPVSYYTALLTHVCRNRRSLARVLREMGQEGIRLLPPDINLSSYGFTPQAATRIRTGLIVVAQMGERAAAEIMSVRRGGAFHSHLDFCRRTDPKLLHHRLIENLIKAGAMDSFGWTRSQMLAKLDEAIGQPRSQAVRASGSIQMEMFPATSPSESDDDLEPPDVPDLPLNLRLQYELQAAGHAISGDPLMPFRELMERCRIDRAPVSLSPRAEGRDLYLAGMVNQIEPATLPSPEEPSVWLDFDGVLVAVTEPLFEAHRQELRSNEPLMIGGIITCRDNICLLNAHTIVTLMKTHQQASQSRQIVLDLENQNKHTVRTLRQICGQFPGPTPVVVIHYESSGRFSLHKLESSRVTVCPPLLNNFRKVLTGDRVRVLGYGEE
jgi:DNA polymerase III alpha subunit